MRNYIAIAQAWVGGVRAGNYVQIPIFGKDAADLATKIDDFSHTFDSDYAVISTTVPFYLLLNKENVVALATYREIIGRDATPWREPNWPSSDGGRGKAGYVPLTGKGPKGRITMDLSLYLALLVRTYQFLRNFRAAVQAMAILKDYLAKKITPEQALALAAKLPKTQ